MEKLLTLREIAKKLGAPEPSIRYYKTKIGKFLPGIGSGKRRRYKPEAVEIMAEVVSKVNQGIGLDEIYKQLLSSKPIQEEDKTFGFSKLVQELILQIKEELKLAEEIGQLKTENQILKNQIEELKESTLEVATPEKNELLNEINNLKINLESLKNELEIEKQKIKEKEKTIEDLKSNLIDFEMLKERLSACENEKEELKKIIERQKEALIRLRKETEKYSN